MVDWRNYQDEVASLFRQFRCEVETDLSIQGVRSKHAVDVWIRFNRFGLHQFWIAECKLWNRRISRDNVLTLKAVVEDVGADRGILIAETGHQYGAHDAAMKTNILLTTLAELREGAWPELLRLALSELRRNAGALKRKALSSFYAEEEKRKGGGIDANAFVRIIGIIAIVDITAEEAQLGTFPVRVLVGNDEDGRPIVRTASDVEQFLELATAQLEAAKLLLWGEEAAGIGHSRFNAR
jgi:hypothetical protein